MTNGLKLFLAVVVIYLLLVLFEPFGSTRPPADPYAPASCATQPYC